MMAMLLSSGFTWRIAGVVALVLALGGFFTSWEMRGRAVADLHHQVNLLQEDLRTAHTQQHIAEQAQEALSKRLVQRDAARSRSTHIAEEAAHAPASKDRPVSPALRDALSGIARMHDDRHP